MSEFWPTVTLGEVAAIAFSGVDKHIVPGETPVRLCNYLDVYRNRRLTMRTAFAEGSATRVEIRRLELRKGDVIITKDSETPDDIGVPSIVEDEVNGVVCGYHLAMLRADNGKLASGFLLHYLQGDTAKRHFLRTANGLTRFGLGSKAVASLPIALPPPDEQAAIARILDAVDTALQRTRAAVERTREMRKSLLTELLSRGIGTDGRVRRVDASAGDFMPTPLGTLPAAWRLSAVADEFDLQNGFTLNADRRARFKRRRYLRVANVQRDALDLADVQELEAGDTELRPRVLEVDDLLVVEGHADRMQIGRCARVTREARGMTFQNHLFRLRTKGAVGPAFACLWLNSAYAQRFWNARCATSSGLNTINQRTLRKLVIPVLSQTEQHAIAELAMRQQQHVDALVTKQVRIEALKKSLMHDLLTGRVRVRDTSKAAAS